MIDARGARYFPRRVTGTRSNRATNYLYIVAVVGVALAAYMRFCPRPADLPLETAIDGPVPATAAGVLVLLHGRGGSIARTAELVKRLRDAGLPAEVSIVLLEGPFPTPFGHAWGNDAVEQATSRGRVRERLTELFVGHPPPPTRVVIAGFSQGAGLAGDLAVEDARIGALASFSPCGFWLRGELPKRHGLRVLLAHGNRDTVCPVNESRSLDTALKNSSVPVRYIEFDGGHTVPNEVVRALVTFATAEP